MSFSNLVSVIKAVVIAPEVLIIAIVLLLYLKLFFYVMKYRKPFDSSIPGGKRRVWRKSKKQNQNLASETVSTP